MLHLTLTRSKNIAEAVNSRNSLRRPAIKWTGRSRRSKFCVVLLQESAIKMLVAIVVVSLIASSFSLPLEERVKEETPQILVQDEVKSDEVLRDSPPYPGSYPYPLGGIPPTENLPLPQNVPQPLPGNNVQVLPGILPQVPEGGSSEPEGPPQLDGAENPPVAEGGQDQEGTDLKTDATFWGYGGGWGYRRPYYSWGGYYSNPYRSWGYGRGYGGWGGYGYGRGYGGWGWGGRRHWGSYWR